MSEATKGTGEVYISGLDKDTFDDITMDSMMQLLETWGRDYRLADNPEAAKFLSSLKPEQIDKLFERMMIDLMNKKVAEATRKWNLMTADEKRVAFKDIILPAVQEEDLDKALAGFDAE